mmetsp:Transcript_114176/g.179751  ORF Transcript_114176/g.179751 Transcript_114176/m.179751 type:complete len:95 (+) Transcript_114176:64-348(+)
MGSLSRIFATFSSDVMKPGSKAFSRCSWGVALVLAGKWIYDSEVENPWVFSEAPTLVGRAQASRLTDKDMEHWNRNIQPKEEQLVWKAPKAKEF